jgi:bifunctional dihydroflavonol 4-reductase/flavanone 4-reductase
MIKPTINGVLNIIQSCVKAKTVKRLVFTSSAGTVNIQEHQQLVYDENNWSDLDFINSKKTTGWVCILLSALYFAQQHRFLFFLSSMACGSLSADVFCF